MRRQYLGDEKDAFKWDYHNFLARKTGVGALRLLLMMTEDDEERPWDGSSDSRNFKGADGRIYSLCDALKFSKTEEWMFLDVLCGLPGEDGGYRVRIHRDAERDFCAGGDGARYFGAFAAGDGDELVLIDPNTGFEKVAGATINHVRYENVINIASRVSKNSLVSVCQGFAYRPFGEHYAALQKKIPLYSTALYWNGAGRGGLMFVVIGQSQERIAEVAKWNALYAMSRPATALAGDGGIIKEE